VEGEGWRGEKRGGSRKIRLGREKGLWGGGFFAGTDEKAFERREERQRG